MPFRLRLATYHDLPAIATVACSAYTQSSLHGLLWRFCDEQPSDYFHHWHNMLLRSFAAPDELILVAVDDATDAIVGFGTFWNWAAAGQPRIAPSGLCLSKTGKEYVLLRERIAKDARVRRKKRTGSFSVRVEFDACAQATMEHYFGAGKDPSRHWHIVHVGVLKSEQRKGAGTAIVRWLLEQARRDQLAVAVDAAPEAVGFYRCLGFCEIGEMVFRGLRAPVMVVDPNVDQGDMGGSSQSDC